MFGPAARDIDWTGRLIIKKLLRGEPILPEDLNELETIKAMRGLAVPVAEPGDNEWHEEIV